MLLPYHSRDHILSSHPLLPFAFWDEEEEAYEPLVATRALAPLELFRKPASQLTSTLLIGETNEARIES